MAETEAGWAKEYPSLKYGSWFWLRDAPDAEPELRQLTGGRAWMEAFGAVRDSTEFLGPVTAADFEQLTRLREAARNLLASLNDAVVFAPTVRIAADVLRNAIGTQEGKEANHVE